MTKRINRRTALKMMAATTAGASLPWLSSPSAQAATGVPQRILFIEVEWGARRGSWEPVVAGPQMVPQDQADTAWAFRDKMSALNPYRDRTTIFQHLDMLSAMVDPTGPANAHIEGMTQSLTANNRVSASSGTGPTIDQFIAQQLAANGAATRLQSLELRATPHASQWDRSTGNLSYSAPGQQVPFMTYVPDVWDRLFPTPLDPNATTQTPAQTRRALLHTFVRGEYDRLLNSVSSEDRVKLTQMRDLRSDLYNASNIVSGRDANRPLQSSIIDPWSQLDEGYQKGSLSNPNWRVHCELMAQLAAAALHTDTTRVVNLSFSLPPDYEFNYSNGDYGTSDSHALYHEVSGDSPALTNSAAIATVDASDKRIFDQVRYTLDFLDNLQETDGTSLLDNTLVVVHSQLSDGSHDLTRLPWLVIGDAQGYLKTGQYMRFSAINHRNGQTVTDQDVNFPYRWNGAGRPHNDLFVTLANAMGIPITTFGNSNISLGGMTMNKGVITQMLA
ncbi:MAG: DUF1552 domain-containing protein [Candidatus Thiodiazotropha sp. 6PLUC2]